VQIQVHRGEPHDLRHDIDTGKLVLQSRIDTAVAGFRVLLRNDVMDQATFAATAKKLIELLDYLVADGK
jgi:hypothetical protein